MATFAVIENNEVVNCIVAENLSAAETITGKTCIEYFMVHPGWTYVNGNFVDPNPFIAEEPVALPDGAAPDTE